LRRSELSFGSVTESFDTISSVESASDLLVSLDEAGQLAVEFSVLVGEYVAVGLERGDLTCAVSVTGFETLVAEAELLSLTSGNGQILFGVACLGLKVKELSR